MQKLFTYLLFIALTFSFVWACKNSNVQETQNNKFTDIAPEYSTILYSKLMTSFNPAWETEEPAAEDYPLYYGGSFYDNDGSFVVCVVGDTTAAKKEIAGVLSTNDFNIEPCVYSYREMMQVMDKIDQFLSNPSVSQDHPVVRNFAGASADVFENKVVVNFISANDTVIQAFKKDITNSPAVAFQEGTMTMPM